MSETIQYLLMPFAVWGIIWLFDLLEADGS